MSISTNTIHLEKARSHIDFLAPSTVLDMATTSAPQPRTLPTPPNFLSLPLEIHIKIYEHYFAPLYRAGLPRLHRLSSWDAAYTGTNILLTNRQIHKDALPVFYATHTFLFSQVAWPHSPPDTIYYVTPLYGGNFSSIAPFLRHLSLRVTPALFKVEAMQTFQCTLQLDRVLPEMLEWCPLLRTLTIDLNSESNLGQRQDLDDDLDNLRHWFLSGRPLDQGTEFFWLFQEAWIRIEIGSPKFPSHAGEVIIPKAQQPLHEVLLCDLETKWVRDWNENEVWEAAYDAAMTGGWVSSKGNAGRDPRGKMVGWTQTGREIWRQTCRKWAIKATR